MGKICQSQKYVVGTLVLSIYIYDRFADAHDIANTQLHLVALCCVVIAAKIEENDE